MDSDESGHSEKEFYYPQEQALTKQCDALQVSCPSLLSVFPNLKRRISERVIHPSAIIKKIPLLLISCYNIFELWNETQSECKDYLN